MRTDTPQRSGHVKIRQSMKSGGELSVFSSKSDQVELGSGKVSIDVPKAKKNVARWILVILLGQVISLLNTGTAVFSQMLATDYNAQIPTGQNFLNYALLFVVYGSIMIYRREFWSALKTDWWIYLFIALCDLEGNFLLVKSYQYTNLVSVTILSCFTIPWVMILSYFALRTTYTWLHFLGVGLCVFGVGALIINDIIRGDLAEGSLCSFCCRYEALFGTILGDIAWLGDLLCLAGGVCYAVSNVSQEACVKSGSSVRFLGLLGFFGMILGGIQT